MNLHRPGFSRHVNGDGDVWLRVSDADVNGGEGEVAVLCVPEESEKEEHVKHSPGLEF